MYIFNHIIGSFLVNDQGEIQEEILISPTQNASTAHTAMQKKHPKTPSAPAEIIPKILINLKAKKYISLYQIANEQTTTTAIIATVNEDFLIIQAVGLMDEIDKAVNILAKRLREWHALSYPELEEKTQDHFFYARLIYEKTNKEIEKELNLPNRLGHELNEIDRAPIRLLARQVMNLFELRKETETYIQQMMTKYAPNFTELAGANIAAKLLMHARSLKHLAMLPASTIQLFGAEKALFRHIKTGARSPKYGIIINHPIVANASKENKGKAARLLADKLSLCARLDYFKGEFKAIEYREEIEKKLAN